MASTGKDDRWRVEKSRLGPESKEGKNIRPGKRKNALRRHGFLGPLGLLKI